MPRRSVSTSLMSLRLHTRPSLTRFKTPERACGENALSTLPALMRTRLGSLRLHSCSVCRRRKRRRWRRYRRAIHPIWSAATTCLSHFILQSEILSPPSALLPALLFFCYFSDWLRYRRCAVKQLPQMAARLLVYRKERSASFLLMKCQKVSG